MVHDCKDSSGQDALELARNWAKAVIAGDKERSKAFALQIRDARETRTAILAAIGHCIGSLGQSFASLLSSLNESSTVPCSKDPVLAVSRTSTVVSVSNPESEYDTLLFELQKKVSWGSSESELTGLKDQILRFSMPKTTQEKEQDMERASRRGNNFKVQTDTLQKALKKGAMSNSVLEVYQAAPDWFKGKKAQGMISYALVNAANRLIGSVDEMDSFIRLAEERYPFAVDALSNVKKEVCAYRKEQPQSGDGLLHMPEVFSGAEHRLYFLPPSSSWTIYIDETGTGFNPAAGNEVCGKAIAVLVPDEVSLPYIAPSFHATSTSAPIVLAHLNKLLALPVGLLGFSARSLHNMSEDSWFQNIRELLDWIWRLLPLPNGDTGQVSLNVIVEQQGDAPDTNLKSMVRAINQSWDKENPERHKRIKLTDLRIAPKDEPNLPWADVAAYIWGALKPEIVKGFKQSGLLGTCYFDVVPELMRLWGKACANRDVVTGPEWLRLLTENDAERKGSLTWFALESARKCCLESPDLVRSYIETLRGYLDSKTYNLKILDRQIRWLGAHELEKSAPDLRFYWESVKLASHNHTGNFSSDAVLATANTIRELLPGMGEKDPQAAIQARLRLAVLSFNAYDFGGALNELTDYDPRRGGRLPDDGLSAGKILSSLGQAEAFLGHSGLALKLFDQAKESFARLTQHPEEAAKQREQTGIYAAIAAMDDPATPKKEKRHRVEQALGSSVLNAAKQFNRGGDINASRYRHHLLTRYLAQYGDEEEKCVYLGSASNWPIHGLGMDTGHPWYLIQYYRWLMLPGVEEQDCRLKETVLQSLFDDCLPDAPGLTVELIGLALEMATGLTHQSSALFQSRFERLKEVMPKAQVALEALTAIQPLDGPNALVDVLPFNYR